MLGAGRAFAGFCGGRGGGWWERLRVLARRNHLGGCSLSRFRQICKWSNRRNKYRSKNLPVSTIVSRAGNRKLCSWREAGIRGCICLASTPFNLAASGPRAEHLVPIKTREPRPVPSAVRSRVGNRLQALLDQHCLCKTICHNFHLVLAESFKGPARICTIAIEKLKCALRARDR